MKKLLLVMLAVLSSSAVWGATNMLEFRHLLYVHYEGARNVRPGDLYILHRSVGKDGKDAFTFTDRKGKPVSQEQVLKRSKIILTAADVKPSVKAEKDPQVHIQVIMLEFTDSGKTKFANFTKQHVGDVLAIIINGSILSAPTVNEPILESRVVIRGRFTAQEAQKIADQINVAAKAAGKGKH
jgi:preprotein translocase subunit SecD